MMGGCMKRYRDAARLAAAFVVLAGAGLPATAQETAFSLELNNARDVNNGCRLVYIAKNDTGMPLDDTSYEVVVFDAEEVVSQFLILEFGALPIGKTKVVQFDLPEQPCARISRLLINDVAECTSNGEAVDVCMSALNTNTRADIGFGL